VGTYAPEIKFDTERLLLIDSIQTVALKGEKIHLPSVGAYGSEITWESTNLSVISDKGLINPNLRSKYFAAMHFVMKNFLFSKGGSITIWGIAGDYTTVYNVNQTLYNETKEVMFRGIVYEVYQDVSLVYDGTGYFTTRYKGVVGEVIEVYGEYQLLDDYIGTIENPDIIRSSSIAYPLPIIKQWSDTVVISNSPQFLGHIYHVEGTFDKVNTTFIFEGLQHMGNYLVPSHHLTISSSYTQLLLITKEDSNELKVYEGKKVLLFFIPLQVKDDGTIHGIFYDTSLIQVIEE